MMTIEHRPEALLKIFIRYAGEPVHSVDDVDVKSDHSELTQADQDLCAKIADSKQGDRFQKLLAGDTSNYGGDDSGADIALCNCLAFWTAKNSEQMDRIFRQSGLYRLKWDERHGEFTYGQMTIKKAIAGTESIYQEKAPTSSTGERANHFKLLTDDELAALPPVQWIIKGVLPDSGLGALFGASGSGKSFIGLDMVQAVASGVDWFGHRTKPCSVIYAALEGEGGIAGRVKAYRIKHGQTADNIRYLVQPFNLLNGDVPELAAAIRAIGGARLVVLDTLNRAAPGADENSSKDMGEIISAAKELQSQIGGLVVLVHHTGKDAAKGLRGHSSLHAALDAAIEVKRNGDNSREWSIAKSKDGEDGASFPFRLKVVEMGIDEDGDKITSCVIEQAEAVEGSHYTKPLTDSQNQGLKAYHQAAEVDGLLDEDGNFAGLHLEAWRPRFYSISTADSQDAKNKAFQRVRKDLTKLNQLSVEDDVYRLQGLLSETFEADFAIKLKATRTPDTSRTDPGQVRLCDKINPDRQDTPLIKGCSCPAIDMEKMKLSRTPEFEEFTT